MKNTMAVTGQIIGGPQYANVNSTTRFRLFAEEQLIDLIKWPNLKTVDTRERLILNAKIDVYLDILQFLQDDCARRIDEQDALRSA